MPRKRAPRVPQAVRIAVADPGCADEAGVGVLATVMLVLAVASVPVDGGAEDTETVVVPDPQAASASADTAAQAAVGNLLTGRSLVLCGPDPAEGPDRLLSS